MLAAKARRVHAPVFAALGDETRLWLITRLCEGEPLSISRLTEGSDLTRQAITKHLDVLEKAGLVRGVRAGRETRYEFACDPIESLKDYLDNVSAQWDAVLDRFKYFVERDP